MTKTCGLFLLAICMRAFPLAVLGMILGSLLTAAPARTPAATPA